MIGPDLIGAVHDDDQVWNSRLAMNPQEDRRIYTSLKKIFIEGLHGVKSGSDKMSRPALARGSHKVKKVKFGRRTLLSAVGHLHPLIHHFGRTEIRHGLFSRRIALLVDFVSLSSVHVHTCDGGSTMCLIGPGEDRALEAPRARRRGDL